MRASPLPFSSPIERSATRGRGTPITRSAKIAPIRANWARFSAVESGLAPMSSRTIGPESVIIWTASAGRSTPGEPPEAQHRGGHPGAGVPGGDDGVGLAALDQVDRHEDRGILLLAQGQRGMLVHADDLGGLDDRDVVPAAAGEGGDDRLVADEDQPVGGVRRA